MEKKTVIASLCIVAAAIIIFVIVTLPYRRASDDSPQISASESDESNISYPTNTRSFSFDMENLRTGDVYNTGTNMSVSSNESNLETVEYETFEDDDEAGKDEYVDASSWGTTGITPKSGGNPMSGFRLAGTYYACDSSYGDGQPWINLGSDGYFQYHMNEGSGIYDLKGWYTYDETVEYADQGADINVTLYFYEVSDNYATAQLVYDPLEGYFIWLSEGFGLMGGDEYFAGYFYP